MTTGLMFYSPDSPSPESALMNTSAASGHWPWAGESTVWPFLTRRGSRPLFRYRDVTLVGRLCQHQKTIGSLGHSCCDRIVLATAAFILYYFADEGHEHEKD